MNAFRRLALTTTILTLGTITVGGLVRATGSGDGCPHWPKCFDRWVPPFEYHALIEWSHRAIGLLAIVSLCSLAVLALARFRGQPRLFIPTMLATPSILVQAILGAIVVKVKTTPSLIRFEPTLVTFHIATAMALVGALVFVTVNAYCLQRSKPARAIDPTVARLAWWSAVSVYLLILVGATVRGQHAGLAFPDWPLMNGSIFPGLQGSLATHYLHRLLALEVGVLLAVLVWRARRSEPREAAVSAFATVAFALYLVQVVVGGLQVFTKLAPPPVVAHVALSALIWAALVAAVSVARTIAAREAAENNPEGVAKPALRDTVKAYVALTKPRIILLLLITTVPTMILANGGMPSLWLMTATVLGGAVAAGAANTINMYFDRDIDSVMRRTRQRPLPAHSVDPSRALAFGGVLAVISFFFMTATVNTLSAMLTQAAIGFYVIIYTLGLKRHTPQNIVIGGAAGAVPVLVGWAAVTGSVGWPAVVAFSVIFFWTPAHFWALAMRYSKDYEAAGVPMMPVVAGERSTQRQILVYAAITVAVTLLMWPVANMGAVYLATAVLLGAWFLRHAILLVRRGTPAAAMGLFKFSISYLGLLFAAMGVDALVHVAA
jgi:heme o synthase